MQGIRLRSDTAVLDVLRGAERSDNAADSGAYGLAVEGGWERRARPAPGQPGLSNGSSALSKGITEERSRAVRRPNTRASLHDDTR